MKKIIFFILFLLSQIYLFSETTDYRSLQIDGCTATGYTNILSFEWISDDTVKVQKSGGISTGNDKFCSYALSGVTVNKNDTGWTISGGDDIWMIPFEGNLVATQCTEQVDLDCKCCGGTGNCHAEDELIDDGSLILYCSQSSCTGSCPTVIIILPPLDEIRAVWFL
ncbi:MAG: hypothetical protein V1779_11395 [bacterium]